MIDLDTLIAQVAEAQDLAPRLEWTSPYSWEEVCRITSQPEQCRAAEIAFWRQSPIWPAMLAFAQERQGHDHWSGDQDAVWGIMRLAELAQAVRGRAVPLAHAPGYRLTDIGTAGYTAAAEARPLHPDELSVMVELVGRLTETAGGRPALEALLDEWLVLREQRAAASAALAAYRAALRPDPALLDWLARHEALSFALHEANAIHYLTRDVDAQAGDEYWEGRALREEAGMFTPPPASADTIDRLVDQLRRLLAGEEIYDRPYWDFPTRRLAQGWEAVAGRNPAAVLLAVYPYLQASALPGLTVARDWP